MSVNSGAGTTYPTINLVFCGIRVAQSLAFCVVLLTDHGLTVCPFSFGHLVIP
jgi:hypothetical protein